MQNNLSSNVSKGIGICTYFGLHMFYLLVLHAPLKFPIRPQILHDVSVLLQKETGSQQR